MKIFRSVWKRTIERRTCVKHDNCQQRETIQVVAIESIYKLSAIQIEKSLLL